ncbi:MAG: hypothetical protein VXZ38_06275, partial [Planctomycetota bacterium]|nr:hypothetical protein [Planctomycetota bacterium]
DNQPIVMSIELLSNSNPTIFSNFRRALKDQNSENVAKLGAIPNSPLPNPGSWLRYNFKKTYLFHSWQIPELTEFHGTASSKEFFSRQQTNTTIPG